CSPMPTPEAVAEPAQERFDSLEGMRAAHAELLKQLPAEKLSSTDADRVLDFLKRGVATGTLLDNPADRKAAQALLDYWRATLYAESRNQGAAHAANFAASQRLGESVLAPFDAATVRGVAQKAEDAVSGMPPEDQELTRRLLLRVVRLAADRRGFEP